MHVQGLMADVHSQTLPAQAGPLPSQDATQAERLELLLGRCAQRDERALQELYQLVSGQLLGILMRILRRRAVAEEALQDVMVKIWQRADQYVAYRGRAMAWITAIARYRAIDLLRRQQASSPLASPAPRRLHRPSTMHRPRRWWTSPPPTSSIRPLPHACARLCTIASAS